MEKVRVLRMLEYVGNRDWVENTLNRGSVPANGIKQESKNNCIKSAIIDQFPEVMGDNINPYTYKDEELLKLKDVVDKITEVIKTEVEVTLTVSDVETLIDGLKNSYVGLYNRNYL